MITTALSLDYTIFFNHLNMTILTRQERERLVLDLYYNQGKTYREISKEARISPRDIGIILKKVIEEKTKEGSKEEQDGSEKNQQEQQNTYLFSPKPTNFLLNIRLH
jgi:transposase